MEDKYKISTPIDRILAHHSGWSGVKCRTCRKIITKAQLYYSLRYYKKPLCKFCQSLEYYQKQKNI